MTILSKQATAIGKLLEKSNSHLSKLFSKAHQLQQLNTIFKKVIDYDLAAHCEIAKFDGKELMIIAEDANWATNLKYSIPDLIKILRMQPEFKYLTKIRYRTNTQLKIDKPEITITKTKPTDDSKKLKQLAANIRDKKDI